MTRSEDIRDQIVRLYKTDRNFACFGPQFCVCACVCVCECVDLHYKIEPVSDHVAKFRGDQLAIIRDLSIGDNVGTIFGRAAV